MTNQIDHDPDFALFAEQYHRRIADLLGRDFAEVCRSEAQQGYFLARDYLTKLAAEERRTGRSDRMTPTERRLAARIDEQRNTSLP